MIRFRRLPRATEENRMRRTENHRRAQTTRSRPPSDLWDLDEPPPTPHNSIRLYLEEIGRLPLLTAEEETDLAQQLVDHVEGQPPLGLMAHPLGHARGGAPYLRHDRL